MASSRSFLSRAYNAARRAGLPDVAARVAATQAAHESNFGKSAPGNNFFGIKAGKSWKGATQKLKTWEVYNGVKTRVKDSFRKYATFEQSFKDWAKLVGKNWPGVLTAQTFEDAVAALGAGLPGGYATDPNYANALNNMNARLSNALAFQLPDTMQAPLSLAETQMRDEAIAQAYASPTRALDVPQAPFSPPSRPLSMTPSVALNTLAPPSRLAPVSIGKVTRAPLDAIPASLNAAPVGAVQRAPLGPVGQFSKPASPLAHPVSTAKPSALAAAPVGAVEKGPALAPAGPSTQATIDAYSQYGQSRQATQEMAQAAQDAAYAGFEAQRANALSNLPTAPIAPAPPAVAPPAPAAVLAPALAPPKAIQDRPVAEMPSVPSAPKATAYDVYSGLANSAIDNTGQNTVGRIGNTTTVTNKYGVTTGMTPYGKQTAVGSLPGITGPVGNAIKGAVPGVAGSMLGGYLGGPMGALIGGLLAREVTKPGGLLSNQQSFQTNAFGTINAAKPQGGLGFASAPSGGYGTGGKMGASFSNRSKSGMQGISPGAAAAIGAGKGGLY